MASNLSLGPDFPAVLASVRAAIEERLTALWDARVAAVGHHGPEVLGMASAARDLTMRGGKRFRAALLAAAYTGVDPSAPLEPALQAGVALELLQSYLLMQDDWMDGDLTRRGGPAAHAALTESLGDAHLGACSAILGSDLTANLAFEVLTAIELPPARVVTTLRLFQKIHQDVIIGQQIDMIGRAEDVEAMHALKTGSYTVRGPLTLGATLAGAGPDVIEALQRFADPLGVAFQLRDDLLGTFGAASETGKPVGNDLRAGKRTAILADAEGRLSEAQRSTLAKAFGKADATEAEVLAATAALEACGARANVTERLTSLCRGAVAAAGELPLRAPAPALLAGAAAALAPGGSLKEAIANAPSATGTRG